MGEYCAYNTGAGLAIGNNGNPGGLTAYCANVTRHVLGNILVATLLGAPAATFWIALPYTAVEQVAFASIAALIGAPVMIAVVKSGLDVPVTRLTLNQPPAMKGKNGSIPVTGT